MTECGGREQRAEHSERVVLINASAARVYWPEQDAVGRILSRGGEVDRVVGVGDPGILYVATGRNRFLFRFIYAEEPQNAHHLERLRDKRGRFHELRGAPELR